METTPDTTITKTRTRSKAGHGKIKWRLLKDGKKMGHLDVYVGRDPVTGDRRRINVHGRTEREIYRNASNVMAHAEKNGVPRKDLAAVTLGDYLDTWLARKRSGLQPQSWRRHENNVNLHIKPVLGPVKLAQ